MTAEDINWKNRYLAAAEAAERREEDWEEQKNLLERLLVRTSVAAEGQDEQLDQALTRLRKLLRVQPLDLDTLRTLQQTIDKRLIALDDRESAGGEAGPGRDGEAAMGEGQSHSQNERHEVDLSARELTPDSSERVHFARRVAELMDHLLNRVSLSPRTEARARNLRNRLAEGLAWSDLRDALREVTELVVAALSRGQEEFETFLQRLDDRLAQMHQHMDEQSEASASRRSASETLDGLVTGELDGLARDVQRTEGPEQVAALKQSVNGRVERIGLAVQQFRSQENEREASLEQQLELTREKLAAVEAYSEKMKEALAEERDRALTDVLTQLPNREAWDERLAFEFTRWERYHHPVTLAVLDIDHFKRINDDYGHKAGDRVIQLVSRVLAERVRATDFIARYGGEEFVLLMPETEPCEARMVVDQLREQVSRLPFHFGGAPVSVSFSAGVAPFVRGSSADQVFDDADRALYRAKEQGRNRVILVPRAGN